MKKRLSAAQYAVSVISHGDRDMAGGLRITVAQYIMLAGAIIRSPKIAERIKISLGKEFPMSIFHVV